MRIKRIQNEQRNSRYEDRKKDRCTISGDSGTRATRVDICKRILALSRSALQRAAEDLPATALRATKGLHLQVQRVMQRYSENRSIPLPRTLAHGLYPTGREEFLEARSSSRHTTATTPTTPLCPWVRQFDTRHTGTCERVLDI